jgi:2-oxoglutarate ferredoxin oxidoreductase subunit beta
LRAIDELQLNMDEMLFVSGIGCAAWIPSPHFHADTLHTLHGRTIAFATGAKMFNPRLKIMVISGDGDLSDIGGNHLIHGARRNMDLTVICANNMNYGMTGGQVCSTTPSGAITMTTHQGNPFRPFDLCRLVKAAGAVYVARYAVTQPLPMIRSIKKALQTEGFTFIEAITPCPVQFGRRNRLGSPADMLKNIMGRCISEEQAEGLAPEELKDKIVTGEL